MLFQTVCLLATAGVGACADWETRYTATGTKEVAEAAATAKTSSPTSQVKGKAFDRFVVIYFENQNYDKSFGDRESPPVPSSPAYRAEQLRSWG